MNVVADLEKSLKFLKENEWCKGDLRKTIAPDEYAYCAEGAIRYALGFRETGSTAGMVYAIEALEAQIYLEGLKVAGHDGTLGLHEYNDSLGVTKADVVALFERTIERLKKRGEES